MLRRHTVHLGPSWSLHGQGLLRSTPSRESQNAEFPASRMFPVVQPKTPSSASNPHYIFHGAPCGLPQLISLWPTGLPGIITSPSQKPDLAKSSPLTTACTASWLGVGMSTNSLQLTGAWVPVTGAHRCPHFGSGTFFLWLWALCCWAFQPLSNLYQLYL